MTDDTVPPLRELSGGDGLFHAVNLHAIGFGRNSIHPRSHNLLAENLLANGYPAQDLLGIAGASEVGEKEITFRPQRLIMQDYAGLPALLDLAALRADAADLGLDPENIRPELPVVLAIDHSITTIAAGSPDARKRNEAHEFSQNAERFKFLKWAQSAFASVRVIPPGKGILHQINLEHLCSGVAVKQLQGRKVVVADSLLGTDSHSTMAGAVGILAWGIGGIEATACLLGYGVSLRWPKVVGVRLVNAKRKGVLTTDIALFLSRMLRSFGVTDRFVEFFGPGVETLSVPDRATISNMAPEYGATVAFFPVDERTLEYFALTGQEDRHLDVLRAHAQEQGYWQDEGTVEPQFEKVIEVDLSDIGFTIAGPSRPDQALRPGMVRSLFRETRAPIESTSDLQDGDIALASITSCTNTANPEAMITAGLVAKRAVELGLTVSGRTKTSFAPGSRVVERYLRSAGLLTYLETLGFSIAGFGCMTCVGNSGQLDEGVQRQIVERDLNVCAVLSGNRNFEARIHRSIQSSFLMSPPLVVAAALAGHLRLDLERDVLGTAEDGSPVRLEHLWPSPERVSEMVALHVRSDDFKDVYRQVDQGSSAWQNLPVSVGSTFEWDSQSLYIRRPRSEPSQGDPCAISKARVLLHLGDAVTTDHISPVGAINPESPAGRYLLRQGVSKGHLNTFGARRGNHEVMLRGTFDNPRLENRFLNGQRGNMALGPDGETVLPAFEAADAFGHAGMDTVICAGHAYGSGSARDWAAKGTAGLGVRAVIACSFERIHRTNLILCGVLPLVLPEGVDWETLKLSPKDEISLTPIGHLQPDGPVRLCLDRVDAPVKEIVVRCAIRTDQELDLYMARGVMSACRRAMQSTARAEQSDAAELRSDPKRSLFV